MKGVGKVAWIGEDNEMQYEGEAANIKAEVKTSMRIWKEKRGIDDDDL